MCDGSTTNELLEAAIEYAEAGFRVFPLRVGSKLPATENGCKDATTDVAMIEETWKKTPYNIGISTDGLLVIDIDGSANPWLTSIGDKRFDLLDCPIVSTPRKGSHRYYRQPVEKCYGNTTSAIAKNVDTRADGGYVVAPPSNLTGGGGYRWLLEHELCELSEPPKWLLESLEDKPQNGWTLPNEAEPVEDPIESGQRNSTLASLGGHLRRIGLNRASIEAALQQTNVSRCCPPLPPNEVQKIAESVSRYEPDQIANAVAENHYAQVFGPQGPGPFPAELLRPPGFLSQVIDFNLQRSKRKQPILALAGALALLSVITGRKVRDDYGNRTNLYILSVAGSGAGKEEARKTNKDLLRLAGAESMLGPESPASAAGLVNAIHLNPASLLQWDEVGRLFKSVNSKYSAPHLANVTTVLMKLFSSASTVYLGDAYADTKKNIAIDQPHAVLYGTTVPKNLFENMTADSVTDGFMGRLLIFESEAACPDYDKPGDPDPSEIVETIKEWVGSTAGGNLHAEHPRPTTLETSPEAEKLWLKMQDFVLEKERKKGTQFGPLWARTIEKARKLAMLHTSSRGLLTVDVEAVRWGRDLSVYLTEKLTTISNEWVSENDFEADCLRVLRWIREQPEENRTLEKLTRGLRSIRKKYRDEILGHLVDIGVVAVTTIKTEGRPKRKINLCV